MVLSTSSIGNIEDQATSSIGFITNVLIFCSLNIPSGLQFNK